MPVDVASPAARLAAALQPAAAVEYPSLVRPVLFVHVSKAGGTLFLDMASRNYNSSVSSFSRQYVDRRRRPDLVLQ